MTVTSTPRPTLSVLMPNYNHARFLPESLGAILAQSYRPHEVIVLDDASTDDSVNVIEGFARRDPIVKLVRHERNQGVVASVNELLSLAKGDYLYSPAADDKVLPGFFEKSMALLMAHPEAGLCSTAGRLLSERGADRGVRSMPVISRRPTYFAPVHVRDLLCRYGQWIDAGTVIYRRDVFIETGQRDDLSSFADTFANLVIALRYGVCYVPEPLHCFRQMAGGYATRNSFDWQALQRIGETAARLMRTEYAGLFPPGYVVRFEQQWRYGVMVSAGRRAAREDERLLAGVEALLFPQQSLPDRVFLLLMRTFLRWRKALWRAYAAVRLGPWGWWIRGRLSIIRNLRTLVLVEHVDV